MTEKPFSSALEKNTVTDKTMVKTDDKTRNIRARIREASK